ncbi:hypothetical protein COC97_23100 [Bacillus anthracis]|nr:hypothetical protein COC97_23100 [Bacillus anthracis]
MLKENEVLYYLINATYHVAIPFQISTTPGVKEDLVEQGYLEDIDTVRFTKKTVDLLHTFYEENSDELMEVLKRLKEPRQYVSYKEICDAVGMSSEENNVVYLMKRLAEDNKIRISASSDWNEKIKYLID